MTNIKFIPTRSNNSCPICKDTKGKCRDAGDWQIEDGNKIIKGRTILCMTGAGADFGADNWHYKGDTAGGSTWGIYNQYEGNSQFSPTNNSDRLLEIQAEQSRIAQADRDRIKRLPTAEQRNRAFVAKIKNYQLAPEDRADLERRGLLEADIKVLGAYGNNRGYGVPIRNLDGQMVGSQIRLKKGGYPWETIGGNKLPDTGELPLAHWSSVNPIMLALCEGTGVKPYIASKLLNAIAIGASGGNHVASKQTLKATLDRYLDLPIVLIPDAGAVINYQVMHQYRQTRKFIESCGRKLDILWSGQISNTDGDIDEINLAETPIHIISWAQFEKIAKHAQAVRSKMFKGFGEPPKIRPLVTPKSNIYADAEYTDAASFNQLVQKAINSGYKAILDKSPPGCGKSTIAAQIAKIATRQTINGLVTSVPIKQYLNITNTHRNPTTAEVETNFTDVPARYQKLYINPDKTTPNGNPHLQRSQPDGAKWENVAGNCHLADQHNAMRSKGYDIDSDNNPICQACPQLMACRSTSGNGFGYLSQRKNALTHQFVRISPSSLPSTYINPDLDSTEFIRWEDRIAIWDDQDIDISNIIIASKKDFDSTIAEVAKKLPQHISTLQSLTERLDRLFDRKESAYHGFSHSQVLAGIEIPDLALVLAELTNILAPDFGTIVEEMDGINTDRMSAKEKRSVRFANQCMAQQSKRDNKERLDELPTNWLLSLLTVIMTGKGYVRFNNRELVVTLPNNYHRDICDRAALSIFLNASENVNDLALKTGFKRDEIMVISQPQPDFSNLEIVQVTGLGNPTKQRRAQQQGQIDALIAKLRTQHKNLEAIDKIKDKPTGLWYRDSRGTNRYQNCDAIVAIGAPIPNLGSLAATFSILVGRQVDPKSTDPEWIAYIGRQIENETIQVVGRPRAQHRPQEKITIYWVVDRDDLPLDRILGAYPGATFRRMEAIDICVAAGTPKQQTQYRITQALLQIKEWTIDKLAAEVGRTKGRLSQILSGLGNGFKDSLALLYKAIYSTTKLWREQNPGGGECPPSRLIDSINSIEPEVVEYATTILTNPAIAHDDLVKDVTTIASTVTTSQMTGLFVAIGKNLTERFIDLLRIGIGRFDSDPLPS